MTAGYTQVTYNGVTLEHCHTRQFSQKPVFDQSDTDLLYYQFNVRVIGYVHGHTDWTGSVGVSGVSGISNNAASYMVAVRSRLSENRQSFVMRMGVTTPGTGTVILSANPVGQSPNQRIMSGFDVNNGPRCRVIDITHVAGNEIFRIEAEFEVCRVECDQNGQASGNGTGILSNRWSVTDEIDANRFTVRTYEGLLRTFSGRLNPNQFRSYVVPTLQNGMRRERMSFTATEDGLHLRWTVVDREVAFSAPEGATNWNYRYTESVTEGTNVVGELNVMMEGDRDCNKRDLIQLCAYMIDAKLIFQFGGVPINQNNLIEFLSFSDESGSDAVNRVYASGRVKRAGANALQNAQALSARVGAAIDADSFKRFINYDGNISRGGNPGDKIDLEGPIEMIGAFAAYLQRPCSPTHGIYNSGADPGASRSTTFPTGLTTSPPEDPKTRLSGRIVQNVSQLTPDYISSDHIQSIYTYWQLDSNYEIKGGNLALPIASSTVRTSRTGTTASPSEDSLSIVTLCRDICYRTVRLAGERAGQRPQLPIMSTFTDSNRIKHTLMRRNIKPSTSTRSAGGNELFRVDAEYFFALSRAPRDGEQMEIGMNPWDTLGIQKADISGSSSQSGSQNTGGGQA